MVARKDDHLLGATNGQWRFGGNLRSNLLADLIRRTLLYHGIDVFHVKNITDVGHLRNDETDTGEDRMLIAALEEGKSPIEIAEFYTAAWLEDEALLNIRPPDVLPKATDHIGQMLRLTGDLIASGHAYEVEGTVYFDVSSFPGYGKLSGHRVEGTQAGFRVEVESDKRNPADFALWKKADDGRLMKWPSPWGEGFPGWHIECSAMACELLGETFDIHGGGADLQFPHHENEIAQSEGAFGVP